MSASRFSPILRRVATWLREEWRELTTISPSDRPWQMPAAAALASGIPLGVGAAFDRLDFGLVSTLRGLVFLHLPGTALHSPGFRRWAGEPLRR